MAELIVHTAASALRPEVLEYAKKVHREVASRFAATGVRVGKLLLSPSDVPGERGAVILVVATGGTETTALRLQEVGSEPLVLVATGLANSLAAAMEAVAALRARGVPVELTYFDSWGDVNAEDVVRRAEIAARVSSVKGLRIGLVGEPSPWLVASSVDREAAREKLGVEFVDVKLEYLLELFNRIALKPEDEDKIHKIAKDSEKISVPLSRIREAYRMYLALREIIRRHKLDSVTVRCFDIIEVTGTTACLALSLLNSGKCVAGCEGDEQSVLTMAILSRLMEAPVWMANPVRLDFDRREIMLAHCTAPLAAGPYRLKTHFETGKGVGVDVVYERGSKVLLARLSGTLDRVLVAEGVIVRSGMEEELHCRTQVVVRVAGDLRRLVEESLGNHLAMAPRVRWDVLKKFCKTYGIKMVRI